MTSLLEAIIVAGLAWIVFQRCATFLKTPSFSDETHVRIVRLGWTERSGARLCTRRDR